MRGRCLTISTSLLAALALAALLGGCGSSSDETGTTPASESQSQGAAENPPASTSTTPGREAPVGVRADRCGEGATSGGEIRVTGVSCKFGRAIVAGWYKDSACSEGTSRTSCKLGSLICLGAVSDRGVAVTCAGTGRSVAFIGRKP
jgi:hypothetical protein